MKLKLIGLMLAALLLIGAGERRGETVWAKDCAGIVTVAPVPGELNLFHVTCEKLP